MKNILPIIEINHKKLVTMLLSNREVVKSLFIATISVVIVAAKETSGLNVEALRNAANRAVMISDNPIC